MLRIATCQMTSGPDVGANLQIAESLVRKAAREGANVALLPEMFSVMSDNPKDVLDAAEHYQDGPVQKVMANLAKSLGIWIAAGTIPLKTPDPKRVSNSLLVYDAFGQEIVRYDKIHLFSYQGKQESYDEAGLYKGGDEPISFNFPLENGTDIRIGLAVCYDLRFPQLFRIQENIDCFLLPAAFTTNTGKAHWEVLLRARAIENLSYVFAAAQAGRSSCGRAFWGHSMAVDPWGTVIRQLNGHVTDLCVADVDPAFLRQVRGILPALNNRVVYRSSKQP